MPTIPEYAGGGYAPYSAFGGGTINAMKDNPALAAMGLGGVGAGVAGMMMPYKSPSGEAMPYFGNMQDVLQKYFAPYINAGQQSLPQYQNAISSMLDPNTLIKNIGAGYQESPGFKFQRDQALTAMQNAQAAGGMMGSPQHEMEAGKLATNLANQDFYNYLNKALGLYGSGVENLSGLTGQGFQASTGLGQDLASIMGSQAGLAYRGAQDQNQRDASIFGDIFSGAASLLPFLF